MTRRAFLAAGHDYRCMRMLAPSKNPVRLLGIALAALALGLLSLAACGSSSSGQLAQSSASAGISRPAPAAPSPRWLITQSAKTATLVPSGSAYVLTLTGVAPETLLFADRPVRDAKRVPTSEVTRGWTAAFGNDPPNAVLEGRASTPGAAKSPTAVLTLSKPVYSASKGSLTYQAALVNIGDASADLKRLAGDPGGKPPAPLRNVSLFIDDTTGSSFQRSAITVPVTESLEAAVASKLTELTATQPQAITIEVVFSYGDHRDPQGSIAVELIPELHVGGSGTSPQEAASQIANRASLWLDQTRPATGGNAVWDVVFTAV